jgi:hypothetical protein
MSSSLNNYTVIMLGPRGSGKTVFLASMYKKLSIQGELGFFLELDEDEKRKRLNNIYTQIAIDEKWPIGTSLAEVSEWTFTCKVQTPRLHEYSACQFTYLDYAGGRITDEMEQADITFERKIKEADALLCLLDGQKVCSLMRGERPGLVWSINDLHNMLIIMQRVDKPIHFVISKWDIVKEQYTLEQILKRLIQIEEFKSIVELRNQANSPVRLIPVSSVGMGFAKLQPDGSMKKTGVLPKPYQVEIPLACVLPDMIQAKLEELLRTKEEEKNKSIEVKANLSFWDRLKKYAGIVGKTVVATVKDILPRKYQFADEILKEIINVIDDIERPIHEKEALAKKRSEELKLKKAESIKAVESEETALKHVVNCFLSIVNQLEINYPQSNIKL